MADKQIIICIFMVGFSMIVFGIVLFLLGFFVINRQCPFEWEDIDDVCLYISAHNTTWASARDFCILKGGQMIHIANENENNEFVAKLQGPTWIGLFRSRGKLDFQWSTGSRDSFRKWTSSPSSAIPFFTECVKVDPQAGSWDVETNCSQHFYAACEYKKMYYPLVLVGPIVIVCGIAVLILSVEVCHRHRKTVEKAHGLIPHEVLPDNNEIHKKIIGLPNQSSKDALTPSWRRMSNKTAPQTPNENVQKSPYLAEVPRFSKEKITEDVASLHEAQITPNDIIKINSHSESPCLSVCSLEETKSEVQLELLLSPKNL